MSQMLNHCDECDPVFNCFNESVPCIRDPLPLGDTCSISVRESVHPRYGSNREWSPDELRKIAIPYDTKWCDAQRRMAILGYELCAMSKIASKRLIMLCVRPPRGMPLHLTATTGDADD